MKKEKKELAIVFGITKDLDFALANVLIGIKKHFSYKNKFDIIVYHDGLSEEIKSMLSNIYPCDFQYRLPGQRACLIPRWKNPEDS